MTLFRGLSLKPVALLIIITFFIAISFPANGFAGESLRTDGSSDVKRASAEVFNFSRTVDTKVVSKELKKLGLSDNDIAERLDKLSDEELHQFASNNSDIYPGGSLAGAVILTAIILAAAYAYIKYTGKRVVIE
jgi:hypothetical protein